MPRDRTKAPRGCQRIATFVREHDVDLDTLWRLVLQEKLRVWFADRPQGGSYLFDAQRHDLIVNSQGEVVQGDLRPVRTKDDWICVIGMYTDKLDLFHGKSTDNGWIAAENLTLREHGQAFIDCFENLYVSPAQASEAIKGRAPFRRKSHDDRAPIEEAWDVRVAGWRESAIDPFSDERLTETSKELMEEAKEVVARGVDGIKVGGKEQKTVSDRSIREWRKEYIDKHRGRS